MSAQTYATVSEWLVFIFIVAIAVCLLVLITLGIFERTRSSAGGWIVVITWIAGAAVWIESAMLTYWLWGLGWLIAGIIFAGIGVLPMALIASAFAGDWRDFVALAAMMALTIVVRLVGAFLVAKSE